MNKTLRNEAILKAAKKGITLTELAHEYGITESAVSIIINKEGYRKCEINTKLKNKSK